jgi:hypothetical protein
LSEAKKLKKAKSELCMKFVAGPASQCVENAGRLKSRTPAGEREERLPIWHLLYADAVHSLNKLGMVTIFTFVFLIKNFRKMGKIKTYMIRYND